LNKSAALSGITYGANAAFEDEWTHLPASYHNQSSAFSFADGHGLLHHWMDVATIRRPQPDDVYLPVAVPPNASTDFDWMLEHMSIQN
jgi:hypothetical protein